MIYIVLQPYFRAAKDRVIVLAKSKIPAKKPQVPIIYACFFISS